MTGQVRGKRVNPGIRGRNLPMRRFRRPASPATRESATRSRNHTSSAVAPVIDISTWSLRRRKIRLMGVITAKRRFLDMSPRENPRLWVLTQKTWVIGGVPRETHIFAGPNPENLGYRRCPPRETHIFAGFNPENLGYWRGPHEKPTSLRVLTQKTWVFAGVPMSSPDFVGFNPENLGYRRVPRETHIFVGLTQKTWAIGGVPTRNQLLWVLTQKTWVIGGVLTRNPPFCGF